MWAALAAAVIPSLLGGLFANKAENNQRAENKRVEVSQKVDQSNKFVDFRKAAIKGGFNPLAALQATGAAGFGSGSIQRNPNTPPLASANAIMGAVQGVADVYTSKQAQDRAQSQHEDRMRVAYAQIAPQTPSLSRRFASLPSQSFRSPRMQNQRTPQMPSGPTATGVLPSDAFPSIVAATDSDDLLASDTMNVRQNFQTTSGNTVSIPVGPDIDEALMGGIIEGMGFIKSQVPTRLSTMSEYNRDMSRQGFSGRRSINPTPTYLVTPPMHPMRSGEFNF